MNKKKRWRVESFLSGALAMLGFAGCSSENEDILCAYGSPSVDYRVVGTVTNEQGEPLKDIQVVIDNPIAYGYYDDNGNFITEESTSTANPDTVYTDKDGRFSSHWTNAFDDSDLVVDIQDTDGEDNGGEFQSKHFTQDEFDKKQLEKGNTWYKGKYEYSKTIQLKQKSE